MRTPQNSSNTWIISGVLAGLALSFALRLLGQPDFALAVALLSAAAAVWVLRSGGESGSSVLSPEQTQELLREFKTIPTRLGQIRIEFNPSHEPIQKWLKSLPESTRRPVEAFIERATVRVKDAQSVQPGAESSPATIQFKETPANGVAPKAAAPQTPTPSATPSLQIDTILIDDEEAVHLSWKVAAGKAGKTVLTFRSVDEILALPGLAKIPADTRFVVDAHLAQGVRGVQAAKALFDRGFKNLQLAYPTAHKLTDPPPTWIRRVVDKTPQF